MDGLLLKNPEGMIGLAVIDEVRKIKEVVYDCLAKNLLVTFDDGETEHVPTEIPARFNGALLSGKEIFIGHYPHDGFDKDPVSEYHVPLRQ